MKNDSKMSKPRNRGGFGGEGRRSTRTSRRFADRRKGDWEGPIVDYKEVELLRKFLTSSSKIMSRKRGGTSAFEQNAVKVAVKRARFLALIPYCGV